MPKKKWDFAPEPNELSRRVAARHREEDLHARLAADAAYARSHEALRRMSELLVEACDSFLDRAKRLAAERGEAPDDIEATYVEEREYHVSRITSLLLQEAVPRVLAKRAKR